MNILKILALFVFVGLGSCREIAHLSQPPAQKLFLSKRVVTDFGEIDGGVLVGQDGVIEGVLTREAADVILAKDFASLEVIDGGDLALMPGMIDSHVHVNEPGRTSWEGYVTATQAAAWGGITTIVDMPLNSIPPTTTVENLKIKANIAKEEVFVDVGFWGGVIPGNAAGLVDMVNAGVVGFKCFLIDSGVDEFPMVSTSDLEKAFDALNGTGTVLAFHAEQALSNLTTCDYSNSSAVLDPTECPDPDLYSTYLASRPSQMEINAVSLVASFVPNYDVHVHIVHVSAEEVVPILEEARAQRVAAGYRGWRGGVSAETCNHYLTIPAEEIPPGRTEYKCSPPLRDNANRLKLWEYIRDHRLDLITSDHSPSTHNLKGPNFMTAWGGISSVQFDLSLFWTQASARGHGLEYVVHYLANGPALLTGLQERKGAIRVGLDADLIFFDPNAAFVVTPEVIRYKNKISPYMNKVLRGKVMQTYLRGQLIYSNGELVGGPKGRLLLSDNFEY